MWTDALTPLRWCYRGLLLLLQSTVFLVPTVLLQGRVGHAVVLGGRSLAERVLNSWSGFTCRVFGIRTEVFGEPLTGPVLIVANHISWADIQALHSVAAMSFVGKAEIAEWPLMGYLASKGKTIYHRRGSHDSANGVVEQMLARLADGGRVAIFPEGGILPGDHIKRFHARMFKVAVESGCPIQPVMIRYVRKGKVDPDVTFLAGENFVQNIVRLMGRPTCTAQLWFLPSFAPHNQPRRMLAARAEEAVKQAFARTENLDAEPGSG